MALATIKVILSTMSSKGVRSLISLIGRLIGRGTSILEMVYCCEYFQMIKS